MHFDMIYFKNRFCIQNRWCFFLFFSLTLFSSSSENFGGLWRNFKLKKIVEAWMLIQIPAWWERAYKEGSILCSECDTLHLASPKEGRLLWEWFVRDVFRSKLFLSVQDETRRPAKHSRCTARLRGDKRGGLISPERAEVHLNWQLQLRLVGLKERQRVRLIQQLPKSLWEIYQSTR